MVKFCRSQADVVHSPARDSSQVHSRILLARFLRTSSLLMLSLEYKTKIQGTSTGPSHVYWQAHLQPCGTWWRGKVLRCSVLANIPSSIKWISQSLGRTDHHFGSRWCIASAVKCVWPACRTCFHMFFFLQSEASI